MSRCCINFTLKLMQLKHISDPSVFKATNNAAETRLNNSERFLYMQHISEHHLSIYLTCLKVIYEGLSSVRSKLYLLQGND